MAEVLVRFCRWVFNAPKAVVEDEAYRVAFEVDQEFKRVMIKMDDWEVAEDEVMESE